MDKICEQPKEVVAIHAKKLPAEIVGRFLQNLSVEDRLKNERVSPHWKGALDKWGWTEQRKLDADIVFEGGSRQKIYRFWNRLDDGYCRLPSLIHCSGPWLRELDLDSFGCVNTERFLPQMVKSIESSKKLEKLNYGRLSFEDFVGHLPSTLRELNTSWWININIETLQALSNRCPNLDEVPFQHLRIKNALQTETLIELIGKFPRQKKLDLFGFTLRSEKRGALASFGQLNALEELDIWNCECLDGESLGAIVRGCQRLRFLSFDTCKLTERDLFKLAKLPDLTVLRVKEGYGEGKFSDAVLKTIAQRGQLEKLVLFGDKSNETLTENSIVYLVDHCKSLVLLHLSNCPQITERSLEAVVTEVRRRHGWPPRTLPSDDEDPGIFYFRFNYAGIPLDSLQMVGENPWLRVSDDPRGII